MFMKFSRLLGFPKVKDENAFEKSDNVQRAMLYQEIVEEPDGKFLVRCASNMYWLAMMVNEQQYNFAGKTIRLVEDIDLGGAPWVPIGKDMRTAFCGVFDGCGKCITGMQIYGDLKYAGLFGVVTGVDKLLTAEIYNVRLSEINIKTTNEHAYAGGVVGYAQEGVRIEKCSVGGMVESTYCAGGIIGGTEDCVTVRRCHIRGKVAGGEITGALVGKLATNSTLINCGNAALDLYGRPEERMVGYCDETSLVS